MSKKLNFNWFIPALVLLLAGPFTLSAFAAQEPMSPEKMNQLISEYSLKVEPLQDQLWAKQMELEALSRAGNAAEVRAIAAEAVKLKAQIRDERRRLAEQGLPGAWDRGAGWKSKGRDQKSRAWFGHHHDYKSQGWFGHHSGRNARPDCPYRQMDCPYRR